MKKLIYSALMVLLTCVLFVSGCEIYDESIFESVADTSFKFYYCYEFSEADESWNYLEDKSGELGKITFAKNDNTVKIKISDLDIEETCEYVKNEDGTYKITNEDESRVYLFELDRDELTAFLYCYLDYDSSTDHNAPSYCYIEEFMISKK